MADNIVANMFGVTPDDVQRQRMSNLQSQAAQYAQLDPMQRAQMGLYQGAGMLGGMAAKEMGGVDPEEQKAMIRQKAIQGLNPQDPGSVWEAAKRLNDAGDTQGAMVMAQNARSLQAELAKQQLEAAQAQKALKDTNIEPKNIGTTGGGTPVFADSKGQFLWKDGNRVPFSGKLDMATPAGGGATVTLSPDEIDRIAQAVARGDMPAYTGAAARSANGLAIMNRAMEINPSYSATTFNTKKSGDTKFTSGQQGNAIRSIGVANTHLDILQTLADAQDNNDVVALNKARNLWREQTGSDLPTNIDAAARIVGQEVVKGVVGSGAGGVEERKAASESFSKAQSPAQMRGAIQTTRQLLNGQIKGLSGQYKSATGKDDFYDRFGFDKTGQPKSDQGKQLSDKDKEAISWAKSNPNDPRSIKILSLHGM